VRQRVDIIPACKQTSNQRRSYFTSYTLLKHGLISTCPMLFTRCAASRYPGNSNDSIIFQSTDLWNQIKNQEYLSKIGKKVGSLLVPPLVQGGGFCLGVRVFTNCNVTNYLITKSEAVTGKCQAEASPYTVGRGVRFSRNDRTVDVIKLFITWHAQIKQKSQW